MAKAKQSFDQMMQDIFHRFTDQRGGDLVDLDACYDFARENNLWQPTRQSQRTIFKREMSRAISRERVQDENGNPIRPNLSIKFKKPGEQGHFFYWGEMLKMKPGHVKMSMRQRFLSITNRFIQLDRDKSFYNKHNKDGAQLEFNYDITPHVENAAFSGDYPDERPEDDGDGEQGI